VAFCINSIIGAGIFGLPAVLYARVGAWSIAAMLLAAVIVALIALCFAEVGSAFRDTGGPYLYAHHTFGPATGFLVGWLLWVSRLGGFASVANLFVNYLGWFLPPVTGGAWRAAVVLALVLLLTWINLVGVRRAAAVSNFFTVAKLIPLALFVLVGAFFVVGARLFPAEGASPSALAGTVLLAIYAFTGFEVLAVPGGEARDPARAIPFALLTALAVVTVVYGGVQVVSVGTLPDLGRSERPLAEAAGRMLGPPAATGMVIGALLSTFGVLHAILLSTARVPFALAEHGQLPAIVAAVHPRFRTPYISLFVSAACILAFTLATTFTSAVTITVGLRVLIYLVTCATLPVLRRRVDSPTPAFRAPAGDAVAALSIAICAGLLWSRPWTEIRQLVVVALVGAAGYLAVGRSRKLAR
jgi:APA family basic amino acid/polyamine antiporter